MATEGSTYLVHLSPQPQAEARATPLNDCCAPSSWHRAWHMLEIGQGVPRMKGCVLFS